MSDCVIPACTPLEDGPGMFMPKCRITTPNTSVSATTVSGKWIGSDTTITLRWPPLDGRGPVRALDQPGVQRNPLGGRIEEQLQRVVARLAMNIDLSGEPRAQSVDSHQ